MNPANGEETVFAEAQLLPPDERSAYLDQATRGDAALRRRIEALLRAYDAGEFLEEAAVPETRAANRDSLPPTEKAGDWIGRYKLLQEIGEGGCGVVYMAEQEEPVRRRVALKIIKLGMDTKSVIARFEAERQALALMDHPNIAKVLDAGATETGRPYFVMELVRGLKITDYCDQARLSTRARLDLFIQICRAIQHAHQKGIIHRDIKPSNILVSANDGVLVPKVIDFGIAKATSGQRLTDKTLFTAFEQFIGTPAYMSPEQAVITNVDIDTRSDVYALGVLLYELLTGRTPFDAKDLLAIGLDEMRRAIRDTEPPKPSTRVSTLPGDEASTTARHRGLDAPRLVSELHGDLDWIVMKALEKDRARRYATANGLAADVLRHLNNEPVVACPPTTAYRFWKFARRNRVVLVAGACVTAALILGLAFSAWQFLEKSRAYQQVVLLEKTSRTEAHKSRQVSQFLQDMLKGIGPSVAMGRDTRLLREIADDAVKRVGNDLRDQPEVQAELLHTLGMVYRELADDRKAEAMHRKALELRRQRFGPEHLEVARSLDQLGMVRNRLLADGPLDELRATEAMLREAHTMLKKLLNHEDPEIADSLQHLAFALFNIGGLFEDRIRCAEAVACSREALAIRQKHHGREHPKVAESLKWLGHSLYVADEWAEGERIHREGLAMRRKLLGDDHPDVADALRHLAYGVWAQGRMAEAEDLYREALGKYRKFLGSENADVASTLVELGAVIQGRMPAEAESLAREGVAVRRRLLGDEHWQVAYDLITLACAVGAQGRLDEAETLQREAFSMMRKRLGNEHPMIASSLTRFANLLSDRNRLAESEAMYREALAMRKKLFGKESSSDALILFGSANVLEAQGKLSDAETSLRNALAILREASDEGPSPETPILGVVLNQLAEVLRKRKNLAEARSLAEEAVALYQRHSDWPQGEALHAFRVLKAVLTDQRDTPQLDAILPQEVQFLRARLPAVEFGARLATLVADLLGRERFVPAEPLARESLAIREQAQPDDWRTFNSRSMLGRSLLGQEKYAAAEPLLLAGYDGMMARLYEIPLPGLPRVTETLECLVQLYRNTEHPEQADTWKQKLAEWPLKLAILESADSLRKHASALARRGQWREAAAELVQAREITPENHAVWHELAPLLVVAGQRDGYREQCRRSVERFGKTSDPLIAERLAKDCLFVPDSGADLGVVAQMADTAANTTNHWATPWFQLVKGLAEYRQGRFASTVQWVNKTLKRAGESGERDVEAYMVLALAQYRLQQTGEARATLAKGIEIARTKLPKLEDGDLGGNWLDWIVAHALMGEAQALIEGGSTRTADTK